MKLNYRLALDLGTNSIGWCVYQIDRCDTASHDDESWQITSVRRMGVRIFSDGRNPKDLASLAASRRIARQARRRRDRALQRKKQVFNLLVEFGLMPKEVESQKALTKLDPYELRAKSLEEAVHPHHFGRALFHLARKRGFRSGRKDFQTEENAKESGKINSGIKNLQARLLTANCKTVGQYLARLHQNREPVLARPGADGSYPMYLAREFVADEFDELWRAQAIHHPELLTTVARDRLRHAILFQRKLKPVKPGKCLFERDEYRALLAHPLSQKFRILQELANLRIRLSAAQERSLTKDERDQLLGILLRGNQTSDSGLLSWARLRSILRLPKHADFNLNTSGRRGLKADSVSIGLSKEEAIGVIWHEWSADDQNIFLHQLRAADRRADLDETIANRGLSKSQLDAIFAVAARMPDDFGSLSLLALGKIVPALESELFSYSDAVKLAGYGHHSMFYDGVLWDQLPYYGERLPGYTQPRDLPGANNEEREHGRIPNPTVHVGLNQLRKIVNAVIKRYGHPKQIIIEVARDLGLSGENRRKLDKQQRDNRARNEKFADELGRMGIKNSRENRQRLQLFEEICKNDPLGAECIYTGERISPTKLFSDEIEIDHILPFSRSLDDGIGNKVLCSRRANREKRQRTPFEAFGHLPHWDEIVSRAERLVPRKAKRFRERSLEEFLRDNDFLARHLNDTAYFSRVSREYLTAVCPPNCVWVSTGRLTAMLRGKWGLNRILSDADRKDRTDHRHHAVDAAVIGACDRSLIKSMADAARRAEDHGERRLIEGLQPPWPSFFDDVKSTVEKIAISYKPDHSMAGGLHNDTIYGLTKKSDFKGRSMVVHRIPLSSIAKRSDLNDVADSALRARLLTATEGTEGVNLKIALSKFSEDTGVRRIRMTERLRVQAISNPGRSKPLYVKTDGNYCYEIVRGDKGKWRGYAVSLFEANRVKHFSKANGIKGDPLVMRLHVDDLIASDDAAGNRALLRVVKLSDGELALAEHFESGPLKARHSDPLDAFKYRYASPKSLYESKSRFISVDELGYVNDPGFKE